MITPMRAKLAGEKVECFNYVKFFLNLDDHYCHGQLYPTYHGDWPHDQTLNEPSLNSRL